MSPKEMIEFLKQEGLHVFFKNNAKYMVRHASGYTTMYFHSGGFYERFATDFDTEYEQLLNWVSNIERIEKRFDSENLPIWTRIDGIIDVDEKFVRLNGKYYTIKFLENLLDQFSKFKNIHL